MSTKGNITKNNLLGMPYGTAQNRLRKIIMFNMANKLEENFCFRCGKKIENINDFSIEHMEAWQQAENPKDAFFDFGNIAFSHLKCNIAVGKKMEKQPVAHGLSSSYKSGCRCLECKEATKLYMRNWRKENKNRKVV